MKLFKTPEPEPDALVNDINEFSRKWEIVGLGAMLLGDLGAAIGIEPAADLSVGGLIVGIIGLAAEGIAVVIKLRRS